jgi:hypothetical protein
MKKAYKNREEKQNLFSFYTKFFDCLFLAVFLYYNGNGGQEKAISSLSLKAIPHVSKDIS